MIPVKPSDSTRRRYVKNIVATYRKANEDQLTRGRNWYQTAHELADMVSEGNVMAGAGVIAALSANKSWPQNQRMASRAFQGELHGHTAANLAKAAKIMAGADPAEVLPMGMKTGHFYRCILNPGDPDAVCIDRHAHDVAVGRAWGNRDRGLDSTGRYAVLAHAYRQAAIILGELPNVVQAVTWVYWTESLAGTSTRGRMYANGMGD